MDLKVVSTMGLTDGDVSAIAALDRVESAIPGYSLDLLAGQEVVRVHALSDDVNGVNLVEGRLPASGDECVADGEHYEIGDTIELTDVDSDLRHTDFTVVGTVSAPLYISYDYGSTTEGGGELYSFLFVNEDNFTLDAYTEIYVKATTLENDTDFTAAYDGLIAAIENRLDDLKVTREDARYQEIYDEAAETVKDGEDTLNAKIADAEKEFSAAKEELDDGFSSLQAGEATLADQEAQLNATIEEQNAAFASSRQQLDTAWSQIDDALTANGLTRDTLGAQIGQIETAIAGLNEQLNQYDVDSPEYAAVSGEIEQYTIAYQNLLALQNTVETLSAQEEQLEAGSAAFDEEIAAAQAEIAAGKDTLAQSESQLNAGYDAYNDHLASYQSEIVAAKEEIADAKAELSTLEMPQWTILTREDLVAGYSDLKGGTDTITAVAGFLPLFFILIVVLMTSNTMVRMIEEERSEIGALTSLGFSDGEILRGYLFYVLSATVFGVVIGYFLGCAVIPYIIANCFPFMLPPLVLQFDIFIFLLILMVAVVLMTLVTVIFCKGELKQKPAALMRPVPPQKGQQILLERIGFIWNHLSFTWKVTMRNIFRFKRRVFMTMIGIAGCTALLLTGFGVKDCVNGVAEVQYGDIFRYDEIIVLNDDMVKIDADLVDLLAQSGVADPVLLKQTVLTCESEEKSLESYLIVPSDENLFSKYYHLTAPDEASLLNLGDEGAIVTTKIAAIYDVGAGSSLTIQDGDGDTYQIPVIAVTENYIGNYIYMSGTLYQDIFQEEPAYNIIVSGVDGEGAFSVKQLLAEDYIVNVTDTDTILQQAQESSASLNGVVWLIVAIATLLAIIVLYNLTSINISERKWEIATLKVLGFYDAETNEYIYREAFILTLLSIIVGFFLGFGLHYFLMSAIERDAVIYFDQIKTLSYLWAFLITIVTSILMQVITYFKLKNIDMIESLKSVE
jgi:putative ABC transport system permease protein